MEFYFDNNATTRIDPAVVAAMRHCWEAGYMNPASQHSEGRRARSYLEEQRDRIVELVGGQADEDTLIFTSGGTESNNLALNIAGSAPGLILVSAVEHPSVLQAADQFAARGFTVRRLNVDTNGRLCLENLQSHLSADVRLVSVMLGNHETGVIQPLDDVVRMCHQQGCPVHCDAVQAVGKLPTLRFQDLGVDAMSFTAHKLHGPVGIGGLICRSDHLPIPILTGGFQQQGLRPGTESVSLVAGLCRALELWRADTEGRYRQLRQLRDHLEQRLVDGELHGSLQVNGQAAERLPHTANIAFGGVDRQAMLMALDLAGICCSTGSACASGSSEPSPVLTAMGVETGLLESSLRFSFSAVNTLAETEEAADHILRIYKDLRSKKPTQKKPNASRQWPRKRV